MTSHLPSSPWPYLYGDHSYIQQLIATLVPTNTQINRCMCKATDTENTWTALGACSTRWLQSMKETLYTFSFPYDIDIMVPWRENPERYRKIQRRGKRQQSESWPRVRFTDRKWKVTFRRDSMHEGRQRRWKLPAAKHARTWRWQRWGRKHEYRTDGYNAFRFRSREYRLAHIHRESEQTPESPRNSHHPLGWKYFFLYMKMNLASDNGTADVWRWRNVNRKRSSTMSWEGSWGNTKTAREKQREKQGGE